MIEQSYLANSPGNPVALALDSMWLVPSLDHVIPRPSHKQPGYGPEIRNAAPLLQQTVDIPCCDAPQWQIMVEELGRGPRGRSYHVSW